MVAIHSSEIEWWIPLTSSISKSNCLTNSASSCALEQACTSAHVELLEILFNFRECHERIEKGACLPSMILWSVRMVRDPPWEVPSCLLAWLASVKVTTIGFLTQVVNFKPTSAWALWSLHNLLAKSKSLTLAFWLCPCRIDVVADNQGAVWLARHAMPPKRPFIAFFSSSVASSSSCAFRSLLMLISFKP